MAKPIRVYWDACTWISYINEERAIPKSDGTNEKRFAMCKSILERAKNGEFEIVTSAFTLAEVCKASKAVNQNLGKLPLFLEHSFILLVPVDKAIGLKAQQIQLSGLSGIKPPDAVHIGSAQRANAREFHTFDDTLLAKDGQINTDDGNVIKFCKPSEGDSVGGLFDVDSNQKTDMER